MAIVKKTKKAQNGKEVIKGSRPKIGTFRTEKERTTVGGIAKPYKYKRESIDTTGYSKGKSSYQLKTEEGEGDKTGFNKVKSNKSKTVSRKEVPSILKSLGKAKEGKWIQKAIKKPGALRAQLGAKPGKPIPAGQLAKAAKAKGKLGQRARLAQTLKKMKKK
jgi:hypothetical protein